MVDICVIMSVYNEPLEYVEQSIDSILNQTKKDFQFLIICDNPMRSELLEFLSDYEMVDSRITISVNDTNIGLAASLNRAINLVEARYYVRMDADDVSFQHRLEVQFAYMEANKDCAIISSCHSLLNDSQLAYQEEIPYQLSPHGLRKILLWGCPILHSSIMVRGEVYRKLGGYRSLPVAEDYDFYLRALTAGCNIEKISDVLLTYRINPNSMTHSNIYKTICLTHYIRRMYRERLRKGQDSHSEEKLLAFVNQYQLDNPVYIQKRNQIWENFKAFKSKKQYLFLLFLLIKTPWLSKYVLEGIFYKYTLNKFRKVIPHV
ncbi:MULTISPECIES: glycosyltransferase [Streptococcus]|uniref:Glycosyltransferase n=1 Tax=Streptococcus suis TaxID=1307 RepID=A0A1P8VQH7_STRSU|nr:MULTISPECIES: glycosyltransferase [Streptococcus]APZ78871.1 Glycosyltransferase [Streptococcus suis]APZ79416.1 Glycosyltransferase [Streptococcus suis]MBY4962916.1 glycosyltransferase [Streptococcus suis]MBY4969263.1 glycosyltransferase [Streptococcus suis]MBY4980336.1 glycosyltransferase [Streptococcus suis]